MRTSLLTAICALTLLVPAPVYAAAQAPKAVASIRPLHSLLASLMQGVAEPGLLMRSQQSPHHYSLRPSERRMLANADIVFWIGPALEGFMPRLLDSLETRQLALIDTPGLVRLRLRVDHGHEQHDKADDEGKSRGDTHEAGIDPHIWLHTQNIERMAGVMVAQLMRIDPINREHYERNHRELQRRLTKLREQLHGMLDGSDQPFLSYHDAYQYFENEFALNNRGFISAGTDIQPGLGRVRELKNRIRQESIRCVFYEAPNEPPLLKALLKNTAARSVALDATGMRYEPGKDALIMILQKMGNSFSECLKPE